MGSELWVASRPQGICRQGSESLVFSWCWGSQLKARSWQCSLLAPKHPQQCAVNLEGMSLDGLCDALEEKDLTLKVFRVYSGTFHCVPLPRKQTFPKALVIPKNQRWALKSAAVFWIFSVNKIWSQVLKEPQFTRPGILLVTTALRIRDEYWKNSETQPTFRKPTAKGKLWSHPLRKKKDKTNPNLHHRTRCYDSLNVGGMSIKMTMENQISPLTRLSSQVYKK